MKTPLTIIISLSALFPIVHGQTSAEGYIQHFDKNADVRTTQDEAPGPDGFAAAEGKEQHRWIHSNHAYKSGGAGATGPTAWVYKGTLPSWPTGKKTEP